MQVNSLIKLSVYVRCERTLLFEITNLKWLLIFVQLLIRCPFPIAQELKLLIRRFW